MQSSLFASDPTKTDNLPGYPCAWSADRSHRYTLWRVWGDVKWDGFLQVIGLNPSTADETENDHTVRRCIGYARDWGYAALCMTNLFSYRATDPKAMKAQPEPTNNENRAWLLRIAERAELRVAAWGVHGMHNREDLKVMELFKSRGYRLHCLKRVFGGALPAHPLYLRKDLKPEFCA